MKKIILLVLSLLITACFANSEFDQNLRKWKAANNAHYRYQLAIGCFCPFFEDMPLTIEVENGELVSMTRADGTPLGPADLNYQYFEDYSTMDRIFTALEANLNGEADEVTVSYDPQYGFPVDIAIDRIKLAVDDEMSLQVTNFEVLK